MPNDLDLADYAAHKNKQMKCAVPKMVLCLLPCAFWYCTSLYQIQQCLWMRACRLWTSSMDSPAPYQHSAE